MPKFVYLGPAAETVAFGITFPKGEAVEATEAHAVKKLTGNPCFKTAEEEKSKEKKEK